MIDKYCQTNNCVFRKNCLRWVNVGDYSLKFFNVAPLTFNNGKPECDYYIGDRSLYLLEMLKSTLKSSGVKRDGIDTKAFNSLKKRVKKK